MDDEELTSLLHSLPRGGDRAALQLFERVQRPLHALFFRLCGCAGAADDLVQSTLMRIWQKRSDLPAVRTGRSYLLRCALNEWRRQSRREGRRTEIRDRYALEAGGEAPETPVRAVERSETRSLVRAAVEALPPEQREVLVLHRFEGLSCAEIAGVLEVSQKTVESRLRLGLLKLAERLRPIGGRP